MTASARNWKEDLEQIFSASVNQQTLEEAAELMVSISATDSTYHEECVHALEEGIRAANRGDVVVVGIINKSGYQVRSAADADELLRDFLRIYLSEFSKVTGRQLSRSH
jgi:hypothetical protein